MTLYVTFDELMPVVDLAAYYQFTEPNHYRYRVPGAHFLLVESGRIYAHTPTGDAEAKAGEMLCFPSADLNQYGFHGPVHYYEAHMQLAPPPRHQHTLWIDDLGPLPLAIAVHPHEAVMRRVFSTFCQQLSQPGPVARALVSAAVWEMLAVLAGQVRPGAATSEAIDLWQRVRMRLAADRSGALEIRALAEEEGMSVDHFIRGFRRRFGVSPGHWRTSERLRQAASRLRSGDEAIKTIAHDLGFEDSSSFSRAFRKYLGVLPSDLRSGRAALPGSEPARQPLMPMNQHVIPPDAAQDFKNKFMPRS
jgi:AraC-like DNA-binding protein